MRRCAVEHILVVMGLVVDCDGLAVRSFGIICHRKVLRHILPFITNGEAEVCGVRARVGCGSTIGAGCAHSDII